MNESGTDCDDGTIVSAILIEIGITPDRQGYEYLKDAILTYKKHNGSMREIAEEVAEKNNVPRNKVERIVRFEVNRVQDQGTLAKLNKIIETDYILPNVTISTKEFISLISEFINNDFHKETIKKNLGNL